MALRVAINGFGRIGRLVLRAIVESGRRDIEVVAVNDLGPVEMPMAKSEIVTVLASTFQPNKMGNATDIVGALKQDRHAGIMGELGAEARMIPVNVKVSSSAPDYTAVCQQLKSSA